MPSTRSVDTNWRGKCEKIGRIVNRTYQTRKAMHAAIQSIRTVLQTWDGFVAGNADKRIERRLADRRTL